MISMRDLNRISADKVVVEAMSVLACHLAHSWSVISKKNCAKHDCDIGGYTFLSVVVLAYWVRWQKTARQNNRNVPRRSTLV